MTYVCKLCGADSDTHPFYNGVNTLCKECHKKKVRENRALKADYYRSYDAKRYQDDPRVKERHRHYQKSERGIASMAKSRRKWLSNNSDKRAAHIIVGNAVRDGRLGKPDHCSKCGQENTRIHGHHEDYTRPLDVIWLCQKCHVAIHRGS